MINLQPGVFAQEHSGSFFVMASFLTKWNELHDAFFLFHFESQFNFSLSIAFLYRTFSSLTYRYQYNEHENDSANSLELDFEKVIYAGEFSNDEGMKDDDLPSDLLRLVAQDEKQILPHQEVTEAINLGTDRKSVV